MEKRNPNESSNYFFNEEGQDEVSQQIMVAYNSGFIEQTNLGVQAEENDRSDKALQ